LIPEIGQFALVLAFLLALVQGTLPLAGVLRDDPGWMALARPAACAQFFFLSLAFACLVISFVNGDFSVRNVAEHSNSVLPLIYRVAASWGSHEGSMLLWVLMLGGWTAAAALACRSFPLDLQARVLSTLGLLAVGFISFLMFASNPFQRLLPVPAEGRDLNPLLQDPAMIAHPPLLYMGYVGFAVTFAFVVAALWSGRLDSAWARWSRPWTVAAWTFLTLGIMLGSWWAYYELGWGGWWFWDPVENASLMPWLVGTALIHSLAVTEKRGAFRRWTALLAILTFSLSLLGTFLVRSGVLTSVHAFSTDPGRGVYILALLVLAVGGALVLYTWRAAEVEHGGGFEPLSRESLLLANSVLLLVATASVMLGTLYPLLLDALGLGKISVGPPYFESVLAPVLAPLAFLAGVGPLAKWKQAKVPDLWRRLRWALAASVVAGIASALLADVWRPWTVLGIALSCWIAAATLLQVVQRVTLARPGAALLQGIAALPRTYWGMVTGHFGLAVFLAGVVVVNGWQTEREAGLAAGDEVTVAGYTYRFLGVSEIPGPNYLAARASFEVLHDGKTVAMMHPEKRSYPSQSSPMSEAAIAGDWKGHRYLSLGEPLGGTSWSVLIAHKPLVQWIWSGCLLMALGGLLAWSGRSYRGIAVRQPVLAQPAMKPAKALP
jgi:cytochrome c-type biogenesis protein CcmF